MHAGGPCSGRIVLARFSPLLIKYIYTRDVHQLYNIIFIHVVMVLEVLYFQLI
jgi:hypothetical protein